MFYFIFAALVIGAEALATLVFHLDVALYWPALALAVGYGVLGCRIVNEWDRLPVLFLGKYSGTVGPGLVWQDPLLHAFLGAATLRDVVSKLKVENVQTRDNVPVSFTLMLTSRVDGTKVKEYTVAVSDGEEATLRRALAAVTECVGKNDLDSILHSRDALSSQVQQTLTAKVAQWGVVVSAIEITDIKITDASIEQAIALKARARKEADAELARAEMQLEIAKKLKEAAGAYDDKAWKLKGIETLLEMCRSAQNNTLVIPSDIVATIAQALPAKPKE